MKDKIALVLDISGSMGFIELFTLGTELRNCHTYRYDSHCDTDLLPELLEKYKEVLFITDCILKPSWPVILNAHSNLRIIKLDFNCNELKVTME